MNTPPNALRERFLASARASLERLTNIAAQLQVDPYDEGVLDVLRREAHRLRGSSGSYGYTDAMDILATLEDRAAKWMVDPTLEGDRRGQRVRRVVDALTPVFSEGGGEISELLQQEIWCVDPPAGRMAEWSRTAPAAGVRFTVVNHVEFRERIRRGERPVAVIAPADVGRSLQVPDGLPLVLMSNPQYTVPATARSFGAVTVVDQDIATEDLAIIIERLSERTSMYGGSVVVLDDDPMILLLVRKICETVGLRSVTIERPDQLLETLAAERPGVLLMDVQLPGTDGFVLTRQLRANPEWSDLPIVLFSGSADQQARDAAAGAGADGFLAKPIAAAELQSQLLARIEQVRQQRIAAGVSPATGLAEHERGVSDAEKLFGAMRRDGGALSAAVVRLSDPADDAAWRRSCSRIARELKAVGAEVAHYDDTALVATVRGGYGLLANALATLRARGGQPDWVVGVAEAATVGAPHVHELWLAAADAAASALASREQFHAWTVEDSTRAPDVMIVEDDQSLCELIEFALLREGYTFKVFRTGPEALEALRTLKVGSLKPLILLDLDLPGLDGHAIHERLRVERPRDYVVVFLSVHSGDSDQVRALRAGAADYLTKPVSLRVLMSKLPRWVRQPRTQR